VTQAPFSSLRPPRAPAELRSRVLAALSEVALTEEGEGLLDRLWQSRRARLAWLVVMVVLAMANLAVWQPPVVRGGTRASSVAVDAELREEVGLPGWWW
jgi:hypothetical protein